MLYNTDKKNMLFSLESCAKIRYTTRLYKEAQYYMMLCVNDELSNFIIKNRFN
jgi:hypothetical protein